MPREHWNDVPGDVAGGSDEDLPGGFGAYNPDQNPDAMVDDTVENDVIGPTGIAFTPTDQQGGVTAGTSYAEGEETGSTVDPNRLVQGEEAHPGAGVGFTGGETDKRVPPVGQRSSGPVQEEMELGGTPSETRTPEQQENMSVETEGPAGAEGAAGTIHPEGGSQAA